MKMLASAAFESNSVNLETEASRLSPGWILLEIGFEGNGMMDNRHRAVRATQRTV